MDKKNYILLVEDNPDDEALTLRALRKNDIQHDVIVARDGLEALEILQGNHETVGSEFAPLPVLILLDLKLPKLDGLGVLQRIRADQRTALQPVVILTTSTEENDLIRGYSLGVNSYLRKPVDFDQFVDLIGELGLYWLALNVAPPQRH